VLDEGTVLLAVQTMLELAKLQLVTGDLQSCQCLCEMMLKNDAHKDTATVVQCLCFSQLV